MSLGATPLPGGPTLNPSTYELLAGIHDVPAEEVVVLPNSPNVLMAAERAAELSEKKVVVVPTRSQQAGLAAAVALDPTRPAADNGAAMLAALAPVRTGAVTEAARDDAEGRPARFHRGDAVGFVEEEIVAWGEPAETLRARARRAGPRGRAGHADRRRRRAARGGGGRRARPRRGRGRVLLGRPARLLVPHRGGVSGRRPAAVAVAMMGAWPRRRSPSPRPTRWVRTSCATRAGRARPRSPRRSRCAGAAGAKGAERLGLLTVGDLLEHLPRDRSEARTIAELGTDEVATVVVEVRSITSRPVRRRGMKPLVEAVVADQTGIMKATFFNQPWLERRYRPGTRLMLQGKYQGQQPLPGAVPRRDGRAGRRGGRRRHLPRHGRALDHADRRARPRAPRRRCTTWSSRCRRACGPRGAGPTAPRRWPPRTSATRRAAGSGWPSRSCCSSSSRCCAAARCAARRRGPRRSASRAR